MRVASIVLGLVVFVSGACEASNGASESVLHNVHSAAVLADSSSAAPYASHFRASERFPTAFVATHEAGLRTGAAGAMGFVPSQSPATFDIPGLSADNASRRYNPAAIPLPENRTLEDHLLTGFVALMLIAYQLRRKHRFLRPHQFST